MRGWHGQALLLLYGGGKGVIAAGAMLDAIFYVVRTGCQWRALPLDFPPWTAVCTTFRRWRETGMLATLYEALLAQWRKQADRKAEPTGAIIDSQSVKTSEKGGFLAMTLQEGQGSQASHRSRLPRAAARNGGAHC